MKNTIVALLVILFHIQSFSQIRDNSQLIAKSDTVTSKRSTQKELRRSRVPDYVKQVETELEDYKRRFMAGDSLLDYNYNLVISKIWTIERIDKQWKIEPYLSEAQFYQRYSYKIYEVKRLAGIRYRDSVYTAEKELKRKAAAETEKRISLEIQEWERQRAKADSLLPYERNDRMIAEGVFIVDADKVRLRQAPNENAKIIAFIYGGSLVKVINKNVRGWTQIKIGNHSGFVLSQYLIDRLTDVKNIAAKESAMSFLKMGGGYSLEDHSGAQSAEYTIKKSNPKTGRRYNGHRYIRGSRGGCYYINADGNKIYVDRNLCN